MKWFERLATWLKSRGRQRMIYREFKRIHRVECHDNFCHPFCTYHNKPIVENYLERFYILSSKYLGIYLHRFWSSDDDGLHDHPWHSISIMLAGAYMEEMPERQSVPYGPTIKKLRCPMSPLFFFRSKHDAHRITILNSVVGPTWSLFIRFGAKRREWGFYRNRNWQAAEVQSRSEEQDV